MYFIKIKNSYVKETSIIVFPQKKAELERALKTPLMEIYEHAASVLKSFILNAASSGVRFNPS